jgi:TP901 family phage tail tape measure protein
MSFKGYRRSIILDFDYNQVKEGVPQVNKQMALLNAEFRKAAEEAKATGTGMDQLGIKQEYLTQKIQLQTDKISQLRSELNNLDTAEEKNSKAITNKTIALKNAETQLIKMEAELRTTSEQIDNQSNRFEDATSKLEILNAEFNRTTEQSRATGAGFDQLGAKQDFLTQKAKLQAEIIAELKAEIEKIDATDAKNAKTIANKTVELKNAETQLIKTESELEKVNQTISSQSGTLGKAATDWNLFKNTLDDVGINVDAVATNMQKIGAAMAGIGIAGATLSISFDKEFSKVKTIADETEVSFDALRKGALKVSSDVNVGANETANALYNIISANIATADSLEVLEGSAKLAKAGLTDVSIGADLMTTVLNAYGASVKDVTMYSDQMIMTQNLAKTTIKELGTDFGKVSGLAATAKVEFAEVGAAVSVLTTRGIGASESMTAMKAILSNVIKPSQQAAEKAAELGIQFNVASLQAKGLSGFLQDVQRKTRGNTEDMATLFGSVEALNAILMLTSKDGMTQFSNNLGTIKNASGTTEEALKNLESPGEALSAAFNKLKNSLIETGDAFAPVISLIAGFIEVLAKAPPSVLAIISLIGGMLLIVGSLIKAVNTVTTATSGVISVFNKVSGGLSPVQASMLKTTAIIIGVVAALTALLALIAVLQGKSGEVKGTFDSIGDSVGRIGSSVNAAQTSAYSASQRGLAIGTDFVKQDGMYTVGEQGEERVFLPRGAKVLNNRDTNNKSNGQINNFYGDIKVAANNADEFVQSWEMALISGKL